MAAQISTIVGSAADVAGVVNRLGANTRHARMIVFIALGGVFLDAYDLTSLAYGETDVAREFGLGPAGLGIVVASISFGVLFGSFFGGWLVDRIGRYRVFMADMFFFVFAAIGAACAVNAEMLVFFRFVMGIGVGMDLPVAMAFLAEFSRLRGRRGKSDRTAAWCPAWYAATSACYLLILGLYAILPGEQHGLLWRFAVGFGAVPALLIILVRKRYISESPSWAANQGDLEGAARILRETYGLAVEVRPGASAGTTAAPRGYRELFRGVYRRRTVQNLIVCAAQNFGYNSVAFGLPVIISTFLAQGSLTTIIASLLLNVAFAFTGGLFGITFSRRLGAWPMTLIGFTAQLLAFVTLALIGTPTSTVAIVAALAMLGLYLFAQGSGPGANLMTFAALSYPTSLRGTGVGFSRGSDAIATAVTLFLFPVLSSALSTGVFWVIAIAPVLGGAALLIGRWEPVGHDADAESAHPDPVSQEVR
ncbi:MFS transporter [Sciscionella sediminilitoris]|uniref:MFS transporter n=1 Tax=Sciscionella sediminilitoris TaxID=1445613 RepID=UPI0004DF4CD0|nr:MFS transporter [Sciscionella sp. SE31]